MAALDGSSALSWAEAKRAEGTGHLPPLCGVDQGASYMRRVDAHLNNIGYAALTSRKHIPPPN